MYPAKAFRILFEDPYNSLGNNALFENQTSLVDDLLDDPESYYYTPNRAGVDKAGYDKAKQRLKTLVSQLFSAGIKRKVTTGFAGSLKALITKKLPRDQYDAEDITRQVIADLRNSNMRVQRDSGSIEQPGLVTEDWKDYSYHVELWIKTVILDTESAADPLKQAEAKGIRQGALLIWNMISSKKL